MEAMGHSIPDDYYGIDPVAGEKYLASLVLHIESVQKAATILHLPAHLVASHDASKFSQNEFPHYAINFHGDKSALDAGVVSDNFAKAWLHHLHHNPHHWQHWIFPDGFTPKGSKVENGVVEMPQRYALEMVADWYGASMAYTKSWDMSEWLTKNMPRIKVHFQTAIYLWQVLDNEGYGDLVYRVPFAQ